MPSQTLSISSLARGRKEEQSGYSEGGRKESKEQRWITKMTEEVIRTNESREQRE
jgi:hypothetical protein